MKLNFLKNLTFCTSELLFIYLSISKNEVAGWQEHPHLFFLVLYGESLKRFGGDCFVLWWDEKLLTFKKQIILNKTRYHTKGL